MADAIDTAVRLSHEASLYANTLTCQLLIAGGETASRRERVDALTRAFAVWPSIARRMAALEEAAPFSSEAGRNRADDVLAWLEQKGLGRG